MDDGDRAAIFVDEYHAYTLSLGRQPVLMPDGQSRLTIHVLLPYDGQMLKDVYSNADDIALGHIEVVAPGSDSTPQLLPVRMPAGDELVSYFKSNKRLRVQHSVPIPHPSDTLVAVDGQILDGALNLEQLRALIFSHTDAFVQNLHLHLSLWAPDVLTKTQRSQERELQELLLQRENTRQVFLATASATDLLAQSLTALANTAGGRILIGVDQHSRVVGLPARMPDERDEALERALLEAALRSSPAVPFYAPEYIQTTDKKWVARVVVPAAADGAYQLGDQLYRREGARTISRQAVQPAVSAPAAPVANLEEALTGTSDDVIVLDAGGRIETLELGPSICGLINANKRDGLILIRNLTSTAAQPLLNLGRPSRGVLQQLEERLTSELRKCTPALVLRPALARVNDEEIGVVRVSSSVAPVALYSSAAYDWENRALHAISTHEVFDRYLRRQRTGETGQGDADGVQLVLGELAWPIQPPPDLGSDRAKAPAQDSGCAYDIQRQAMVWKPRPFIHDQATAGWRCRLSVPLHQALMDIAARGDAIVPVSALQGQLLVRFHDVLSSGATVRQRAASGPFSDLPIHKRTNVQLKVTADPQALFQRRRRMSLLRFRVPDVMLDSERVGDLRQALADLGFRIGAVDESRLPDRALIEGIRSEGFCDILLLAGLVCERTPMTRLLHYQQRTDRRLTSTGSLDIRIALWGTSDAAASAIAQLQMAVHAVVHQRFHYLHAE